MWEVVVAISSLLPAATRFETQNGALLYEAAMTTKTVGDAMGE
jgi:hypothetical protein